MALTINRRDFLRSTIGSMISPPVFSRNARTLLPSRTEKTVIVTFEGGARDDEIFAEDGQRNIPHLLYELLPQGTFFARAVNHDILGHYVATASIVTGCYERFNNFVAQPPPNPTLFEYFRKGLARPETDAWVIAPINGFQQIGQSKHRHFGPSYGAGVILPKRLLSSALGKRGGAEDLSHLLQDSYEAPAYDSPLHVEDLEIHLGQLYETLSFSVDDFSREAAAFDSPDELSIFIARRLMERSAPHLLLLTLNDMDIAHAGAYSLYVDAIQRADRLCGDLWRLIQGLPE